SNSISSLIEEIQASPLLIARAWYFAAVRKPALRGSPIPLGPELSKDELATIDQYHTEAFHKLLDLSLSALVKEFQLFIDGANDPSAMLHYMKAEGYVELVPPSADLLSRDYFVNNSRIVLRVLAER